MIWLLFVMAAAMAGLAAVSPAAIVLHPAEPMLTAGLVVASVPAAGLWATAVTAAARRRLRRRGPEGWPRIHMTAELLGGAGIVVVYGLLCHGTAWVQVCDLAAMRLPEATPGWVVLLAARTLVLAPIPAIATAARWGMWGLNTALGSPTVEGRWAWTRRLVRLHVLPPFVPLLGGLPLICVLETAGRPDAIGRLVHALPAAQTAATLVLLAGLLWIGPPLLVRVLGCRPLPDGPLRRRLEQLGRRADLRWRDLVVWPSGDSMIVNAAVLGLTPGTRYVILTDALVAGLPQREVEGVFAHEAAHAIRGHLLLFLAAAVGGVCWLSVAGAVLEASAWGGPAAEVGLAVVAVLVFVLGIFGWLSRRLEQDADVHGALLLGDPMPLADALRRLGRLSGGGRFSLRHPPLPDRVRMLQEMTVDQRPAAILLRRVAAITAVVVLTGVLGAAALGAVVVRQGAERRAAYLEAADQWAGVAQSWLDRSRDVDVTSTGLLPLDAEERMELAPVLAAGHRRRAEACLERAADWLETARHTPGPADPVLMDDLGRRLRELRATFSPSR